MAWAEAAKRSPFRASGAAQPSLAQKTEAASVQAGSLVEAAPVLASATGESWEAGSVSAKAPRQVTPMAMLEVQQEATAHLRTLPIA